MICTLCKVEKASNMFRKDASRKTGLFPWCKECCRKKDRERYASNPEPKKRAAQIRRQKVGSASHTAYCREWLARNKDHVLDYQRAWRALNREACAKRIRDWRRANPGRHRASNLKRRLRMKTNDPRVTALYEIAAWLRSKGDDVHVDHIHPLSKGGAHTYENLQILTAQENMRKSAKLNWE